MRPLFVLVSGALCAMPVEVCAQPRDARIDAANAARLTPRFWIGRASTHAAFAGASDALWLGGTDGVTYVSARERQRTVSHGGVLLADAAPAATWMIFAEQEPPRSPVPAALAGIDLPPTWRVRVVDPTGVAAPSPAGVAPDVERIVVARGATVASIVSSAGVAQSFTRGEDGRWVLRGRIAGLATADRVALSRDGSRLAAVFERAVRVFDTSTGRRVSAAPAPRSWCPWSAARCPDRSEPVDTRWLDVCVADDGAVRAIGGGRAQGVAGAHRVEVFTAGRGVRAIAELTGTLQRARFSPDCERVAVTVLDGQGQSSLQTLQVSDGASLTQQLLPGADVRLAWSPDGAALAVTHQSFVTVLDVARGNDALLVPDGALGELVDEAGAARGLDAVPDGARAWLQASVVGPIRYALRRPERRDDALLSMSADGSMMAQALGNSVGLFSLARFERLAPITLPYRARWLSLSADGRTLALATPDGLELRATQGDAAPRTLTRERDERQSLWSARGRSLAFIDARGGLRAVDGDTGATLQRLAGSRAAPVSALPNDDLFARFEDRATTFWNARTGRSARVEAAFGAGSDLTPDGAYGCTTGDAAAAFRLGDGARVAEGGPAEACTLSASGSDAAWRSARSNVVRVTRLAGGAARAVVADGGVGRMALSSSGDVLAMASSRTVTLYDTHTTQRITSLTAGREVAWLAFSPDGTLLVMAAARPDASGLQSAEVWSVEERSNAPARWAPPALNARR